MMFFSADLQWRKNYHDKRFIQRNSCYLHDILTINSASCIIQLHTANLKSNRHVVAVPMNDYHFLKSRITSFTLKMFTKNHELPMNLSLVLFGEINCILTFCGIIKIILAEYILLAHLVLCQMNDSWSETDDRTKIIFI